MMNHWDHENCGGCATLSREPGEARKRSKRLVLAGGSSFASRVADHFRRQGWQVQMVAEGENLTKAVRMLKANAVLVDTHLGEQSGFLACAKLHRAKPRLPIVLVGAKRSAKAERFADFVGASAFLCESDLPDDVIAAVGAILNAAV